MLRHAAKSAIQSRRARSIGQVGRSLATQSGDDTKKPTALAKIHLEDGTTLVGKSFGCHEGAEGEVSKSICVESNRIESNILYNIMNRMDLMSVVVSVRVLNRIVYTHNVR